MMDVSRNVILDLLPLYLSDEASPDTRALVDAHLERDAELSRIATQWKKQFPAEPPAPVKPEAQAIAYREAKRQITNRVITLAIVIAVGFFVVAGAGLAGAMFLLAR